MKSYPVCNEFTGLSMKLIILFSGQYDRYPSLIQQNTLNNNMGNPRLPPYPHPINVYPSYQIKQPLNISMNPGTKNSSPTHSPTGIDNIFSVAAKFSTPRMCVVGSPKLGMERRGNILSTFNCRSEAFSSQKRNLSRMTT